jgi:hypothetical protein
VPVSFTNLWTILDNNKFDFYACGHSHLYSRKTIDWSVPPDPQTNPPRGPWKNSVVQLLNGTCGAGPGGTITKDPSSWQVHNQAGVYYFSVADIHNALLTVTTWGYDVNTGAFSVVDTFTKYQGAQIGPNLLLLSKGRGLAPQP